MDHDTYSANDAIGKVNISLNPLLLPSLDGSIQNSQSGKGSVMSGWLPVYDTMHGIRGEINIIVKVDLFSDANKFRQSSCGIQFFHCKIHFVYNCDASQLFCINKTTCVYVTLPFDANRSNYTTFFHLQLQ